MWLTRIFNYPQSPFLNIVSSSGDQSIKNPSSSCRPWVVFFQAAYLIDCLYGFEISKHLLEQHGDGCVTLVSPCIPAAARECDRLSTLGPCVHIAQIQDDCARGPYAGQSVKPASRPSGWSWRRIRLPFKSHWLWNLWR